MPQAQRQPSFRQPLAKQLTNFICVLTLVRLVIEGLELA